MLGELLIPEIRELVAARRYRELRDQMLALEPADLAEIIDDLHGEDLVVVFRLLPKALATEVFEHLDRPGQEALLRGLKSETVRALLEEMSADDRTALLEDLPPDVAGRLLEMLSPEERVVAQALLNYPEESVGRLMTPDFIYLRQNRTVRKALEKIRRVGADRETVYDLYVVDRDRKFIGHVPLSRLVTTPLDTLVSEIVEPEAPRIQTHADREQAAEMLRHYDLTALPVVDRDDRLVGIVTVDDIMDVVEAEHTEDVQLQAAVLPDEASYLTATIGSLARRRFPWLLALLTAEMAGAILLQRYNQLLEAAIALAFFLPVMIATGGNTGTQSAALLIRALATGEVSLSDWARLLLRDLAVGLLLAALLGAAAFGMALLVQGDPLIGLCVASGLVAIVLMANLAGTVLPLLFKRLRMDPALMSGPFISTLVDIAGLVLYMEISILILRHLGQPVG